MKISVLTLLWTLVIFLNAVQSSPMRKWQAPNLRVKLPPLNPELQPPQLCYQKGQLVGVCYNGKLYFAEEEPEPEPAPRSPSPPPAPPLTPQPRRSFRPMVLRFPDGALMLRRGHLHGKARGTNIYDFQGQLITQFNTGDSVVLSEAEGGAVFAVYAIDRFVPVYR